MSAQDVFADSSLEAMLRRRADRTQPTGLAADVYVALGSVAIPVRGPIPGWREPSSTWAPSRRATWILLAASLLLALSAAALVAGLWRDDPIPVPTTERIELLSPDAAGNGPSAYQVGIAALDPRLIPVGPDEAWARDDWGVWHYLDGAWSGPYLPEVGAGFSAHPMAVDPDGSVWYGVADGVAVLRGGVWTPGVLRKSRRLAVATDGAVWSITTAGHVQRNDPRTGAASSVVGCREPNVLEPGPDGTMYVGTLGYMTGRVYVVRGSRCEPLDPLGDGESYYVGDLAADGNGRLLAVLMTDPNAAHDPPLLGGWINYIALLDEGRWTVLTEDVHAGNGAGVISGWDQVAFAPDGSIWRARMKEEDGGIERWDGRAWQVVIPGVKVYSSMSFGPDGTLWFEGEFGLFRVRPDGLREP